VAAAAVAVLFFMCHGSMTLVVVVSVVASAVSIQVFLLCCQKIEAKIERNKKYCLACWHFQRRSVCHKTWPSCWPGN